MSSEIKATCVEGGNTGSSDINAKASMLFPQTYCLFLFWMGPVSYHSLFIE